MRISQRARYAVLAAVDLAVCAPENRGARSVEIARRTGVPEKFLEAILRDLREAGLVTSKRGPDGGHRLALPPERVRIRTVVEAIDGPISATPVRSGRGVLAVEASVRNLWGRIEAAVGELLDSVTLDDLRRDASLPGPLDFTI